VTAFEVFVYAYVDYVTAKKDIHPVEGIGDPSYSVPVAGFTRDFETFEWEAGVPRYLQLLNRYGSEGWQVVSERPSMGCIRECRTSSVRLRKSSPK
jgi:hypothetical protein